MHTQYTYILNKGSIRMNEVKSPKKPMLYYYAMALLVLLLINFLAVPWLSQPVSYTHLTLPTILLV